MPRVDNPPPHPEQSVDKPTLFVIGADGSAKVREVWIPTPEVREKHQLILRRLGGIGVTMPYATGSMPRKQLIDNVAPHRRNNHFFMTDIRDAFPSVDKEELSRRVHNRVYRFSHNDRETVQLVDDFVKKDAVIDGEPGLPLGYPASPLLFNIYCSQMDTEIANLLGLRAYLADNHHAAYTRYLDDLTISSQSKLTKANRRGIRDIVQSTPGFQIADHKTRVHSLAIHPVTITGLSIQPGDDRIITPSPELIGRVQDTFDELEDELTTYGYLTEQQRDMLNGINSILHLPGNHPSKSARLVIRQLTKRYQRLLRRAS